MFPKRLFTARMFAPRYFSPVPDTDTDKETIAGGRRVFGNPIAQPNVQAHGISHPNVTRGGIARIRQG